MTDKKTETKTKSTLEDVQGVRHPLAVVKPQPQLEPLPMTAIDYNDPKVVEAIKAEICPSGITETEFRIFIDKCRQSGLNPLLGECFCVPRWLNVKTGPDTWSLVKKNQFQAAEVGMASRAEKFDGYRGIRFGMIHENDSCEINTGTGDVKHSYNLCSDRGAPMAAWAQVIREGFFFSPDVVWLKDYEQRKKGNGKNAGELTEMWQKPEIMLPKVARAAAFRRAFPTPFSGVYAREEMRDDDERADLESDAGGPVDQRPTTDKLADRARAERAKQTDAQSVPAAKAVVDVVAEKPKPEAVPPKAETPPLKVVRDRPTKEQLDALVSKLEAAGLPYDGQKLVDDRQYFEAKASELEQLAKRAAGAVSQGTMDRADKGGPPPVEKPKEPVLVFGPDDIKGKPVASLTGEQLLQMGALGRSKLGSLKTDNKSTAEQKAAKVNACLAAIDAELKRRDAALLEETPEPGLDVD